MGKPNMVSKRLSRTGPKQTGLYSYKRWLEAANFGFKKRNCTFRVPKTKALISFIVTAKLSSPLVSFHIHVYPDCWFSHEAAHISSFSLNAVKHVHVRMYF